MRELVPPLPTPFRCNPADFCAARHCELFTRAQLEEAVRQERDRCAKLCEDIAAEEEDDSPHKNYDLVAMECAAAIRESK